MADSAESGLMNATQTQIWTPGAGKSCREILKSVERTALIHGFHILDQFSSVD